MPAIRAATLDGMTWSPESARGSVLVVDVWASWCPPCRKGFPRLNAIAARYPSARFIAISIDEERAAMEAFLAEVAVAIPVAHDASQQVLEAPLLVTRVPTVLVIDAAGVIRHRFEEPTAAEYDEIERVIGALID